MAESIIHNSREFFFFDPKSKSLHHCHTFSSTTPLTNTQPPPCGGINDESPIHNQQCVSSYFGSNTL
jgi:hypothetical protein